MEINHIIPFFERFWSFALLAIIVLLAVSKYLPTFISNFLAKIDKINEDNNKNTKEMQALYADNIRQVTELHRSELGRIADKFEKSVENSTVWHQKHSQDMAEIKNLLVSGHNSQK